MPHATFEILLSSSVPMFVGVVGPLMVCIPTARVCGRRCSMCVTKASIRPVSQPPRRQVENVAAIVLAGGAGKRMKADKCVGMGAAS